MYIHSPASSSSVDFSKDLSLLTHLSAADIDRLQAVGRDAQAMQQHFILRDDQDKAWKHVSSLKRGQIDFVLDNGLFLSLNFFSCLNNNGSIQRDSRLRAISDPSARQLIL
jgi:Damage-control phosphatase ARMT1-like domain